MTRQVQQGPDGRRLRRQNEIPTYCCSTCRDSGETLDLSNGARQASFIPCPDCDGIPRLCGEPDLDMKGNPAHIAADLARRAGLEVDEAEVEKAANYCDDQVDPGARK